MKNLLLYVVVFMLFGLPFFLWQVQNDTKIQIAILDKTVPDFTYREHNGLIWLLNHYKFKKRNGESYNVKDDYFGYKPLDDQNYVVKSYERHEKKNRYNLFG